MGHIKEDFKELVKLPTPISLKCVTGEALHEHCGAIELETVNDKGHICTLKLQGIMTLIQQ